jgi:hypothetical protein
MDIQKITHKNFRSTVLIAIVLSGMVVTIASFLGRGAMAISGALLTEKPTELTVTMLLEPLHITPEEIYELPERNDKTHRYSVLATDHETYFMSIAPDRPPWKLARKPQPLH